MLRSAIRALVADSAITNLEAADLRPDLVGTGACTSHRAVSSPKCCVYILRSLSDRTRYYTGVTSHPRTRLDTHNAGGCRHTADVRPWEIDVLIEFADERRALAFERYLKSGSGCAFAQRHLR